MLTIRMQRLGRKGHPTYRVVVQDIRQTPTSGKYVALLGSFDPHSKSTTLSKEKAEFYLTNGARPSDRVARLLTEQGVKLPAWVKQPTKQSRGIRNPDKLRRNRPAEEAAPDSSAQEPTETPSPEVSSANESAEASEVPEDSAEEVAANTEMSESEEQSEKAPVEESETPAPDSEDTEPSQESADETKA